MSDERTTQLPGEGQLAARLRTERARRARDLGIDLAPPHYRRPVERPFVKADRHRTTILFGGLTTAHEQLITHALHGLGHEGEALPCPDVRAFQTGKEYGNPGQCNPNYFTVGNLVQHLQGLREAGASRDELIDRFVLVTGGACGPCRFGMYEAEYRLALRNAGFDGFRVVVFDKDDGFDQTTESAGIDFDVEFFMALLYAILLGDLLNDLAYQIRPFEVEPGRTDAVLVECLEHLGRVLAEAPPAPGRLRKVLRRMAAGRPGTRHGLAITEHLLGRRLVEALGDVGDRLAAVQVDRTRVRPVVKVTGEFWAQTTEGDGNFRMFSFLEREGAQVIVEPVGTWLMYLLHQSKQRNGDRKGIAPNRAVRRRTDVLGRLADEFRVRRANAPLTVAEALVRREWDRHRAVLGGLPHGLADQYELQRLAHPYYNSRAAGGEGHLEVAKNLYYSTRGLSHMVLSLKPFGCMPSTQSDAVQSAVTSHFPDMVFLPVETSGDGEVNAQSRVQMALGDARAKCTQELDLVLKRTGIDLDAAREYAAEHPELTSAMYRVPRVEGVAGTAAGFVLHIADRMRSHR